MTSPSGGGSKAAKEMGAIIIETNYISEKKMDTLSPKSPRPSEAAAAAKSPAKSPAPAPATPPAQLRMGHRFCWGTGGRGR